MTHLLSAATLVVAALTATGRPVEPSAAAAGPGRPAADPAPVAAPAPLPPWASGPLVVVEAESAGSAPRWIRHRDASGAVALRWAGGTTLDPERAQALHLHADVPGDGRWRLHLRNRTPPAPGLRRTSVWVAIDDGPWTLLASHPGAAWTWATRGDDGAAPVFDLAAGPHRVWVAGHTPGFLIDRLFLLRTDGGDATADDERPPSRADDEAWSRELGRLAAAHRGAIAASPSVLAPGDDHETLVTLDAGGLLPDAAVAGARLSWEAPGATSLLASAGSPVAQATFPGGAAEAVAAHLHDGVGGLERSLYALLPPDDPDWSVLGTPAVWQPLQLVLRGPLADEADDDPNPFLDLRLDVTLTAPDGRTLRVPGFFDGDGAGGGTGRTWKVRLTAHVAGVWRFAASFREGADVAVAADPLAGAPAGPDGVTGEFRVLAADPAAEGFAAHGRLSWSGGHYLRFADGTHFLKGGTDSPENLLGFEGFDGVQDNGGIGIVHRYAPHVDDWQPGDPDWVAQPSGVSGRGLIGALNYLGSQGVNSVYFLPMNLGGDGQETCPFLGYAKTHYDKTHYDVSRLHQWSAALEHAQRKGILLHVVLAETESGNERWLDEGALGVERKLYFRELVARFGHSLALKWNLCEEPDFFDPDDLAEQAAWLADLDPWDHPIAAHTFPSDFSDYEQLVGNPDFSATSIQYWPSQAGALVETWRAASAAAGHPWVLDMDENAPATTGLSDDNAADLRRRVLYDVYFSGGGIEWYAGSHALPVGGDLDLEDFRTREEMWTYMRHARTFLQDHLPFWDMAPADELLCCESDHEGGGEVFLQPGRHVAIYLPRSTATGTLDMSGLPGTWEQRWFDPRTGALTGEATVVSGGGPRALGAPPSAPDQDWVVWLRRTG